MDTLRRFYKRMFGAALSESGAFLSVFTVPNKNTKFFRDATEAAAYSHESAHGAQPQNVYFGCGLVDKPKHGRGTAQDVRCLVSMWADVDVNESTSYLPNNKQSATALINSVGVPPTAIVDSGYGLQPHWLLSEPWVLSSPDDIKAAAQFCKRWAATVQAVASKAGCKLDVVGDLARVMRPPGTLNLKHDAAVETGLTCEDWDKVYHLDELEEFMVDPTYLNTLDTPAPAVHVDTGLEGSVDQGKLSAMLTTDTWFANTWKKSNAGRRGEWSTSEYHMSLASSVVQAGWTDQEAHTLLVAFNKMHKLPMDKLHRDDYVRNTLAKARESANRVEAVEVLTSMDIKSDERTDPDEKKKVLDAASKLVGVDIVDFVQHGRERSIYSLVLPPTRYVRIGSARDVRNQTRFLEALMDATTQYIPPIKGQRWHNFLTALFSVATVDDGDEFYLDNDTRGWLSAYLESQPVFGESEWADALDRKLPCIHDGRLYVSTQPLRHWLSVSLNEKIATSDLLDRLRRIGFRQKSLTARMGDRKINRSYNACPMDDCFDLLPAEKLTGS